MGTRQCRRQSLGEGLAFQEGRRIALGRTSFLGAMQHAKGADGSGWGRVGHGQSRAGPRKPCAGLGAGRIRDEEEVAPARPERWWARS